MNHEAVALIEAELATFSARPYAELAAMVNGSPYTGEMRGPSGMIYQIEIQAFWDSRPGGAIRIIASIDDRTLLHAMRPLSRDEIIRPP